MKTKLLLTFNADSTNHPAVYELVKIYDLHLNILKASINDHMNGELLMDVEGDQTRLDEAIRFLEGLHIQTQRIRQPIRVDEKQCVHCGLCTSVCKSNALFLGPSALLGFDEERCIGCNWCLNTCPVRAISA